MALGGNLPAILGGAVPAIAPAAAPSIMARIAAANQALGTGVAGGAGGAARAGTQAAGMIGHIPSQLALGPGSGAIPLGAIGSTGTSAATSAATGAASQLAGAGAGGSGATAAAGAFNPALAQAAWQFGPAASGAGGQAGGIISKLGGRAGLMRGGMLAGAGILAGQASNQLINDDDSSWDEGLSAALTGAGIGAGLGTIVPGVGNLVGGAVGGAIGAGAGLAIGLFGPKNTGRVAVADELESQTKKMTELLSQYGASDELREEALMQLQLGTINAGSKDEVRAISQQVTSYLGQAISADKQTAAAERFRAANAAAVQSWLGPMMQEQLANQQFYADQSADSLRSAAATYADPSMAASTRVLADRVSTNAAQAGASQLGQLASTPSLMGYYSGIGQDGTQNADLASLLTAQPTAGTSALEMMLAGQ